MREVAVIVQSKSAAAHADACAPRLWHMAVMLLLAIAQVWAAAGSNGMYDTARDLYEAERIVSGVGFPLSGPPINNSFHLGPLWFYLLAAVLWLFRNPVAGTGAMAAIGALQFPLAYQLGRRYGSARLGLLFALALVLPGWSAFTLVSLTHVTVLVTCVLFGALAALRYRERPGIARAAMLGLAIGLMVHAHPTTLLLAMIFALASARITPLAKLLAHASIVIGAALLLFVPMLVEQVLLGWPDLASSSNYANSQVTLPSPMRLGRILLALLAYGADYVSRYWLELPRATLRLLLVLNAVYFFAAAAGLALIARSDPQRRRWAAVVLVMLIVQTAFVAMLREFTPFWMIYAHLPIIAALVALGLDRLCDAGRAGKILVVTLALSWSAWSLATWQHMAQGSENVLVGHAKKERRGLLEISEHQTRSEPVTEVRLPFSQLFQIGPWSCAPITLYAHYGYFVDHSFGIGALEHCGSVENIRLGGMPDPASAAHSVWTGLRDYAWNRIGLQPERYLGSLGISEPIAVWHSPQAFAMVKPYPHPPRTLKIDSHRFTVSGDAAGGEAVIVSYRARFYGPFQVAQAHVDGMEVTAKYSDPVTVVFRAPDSMAGKTSVHWSIDIDSTPDFVDVLTVAGAK